MQSSHCPETDDAGGASSGSRGHVDERTQELIRDILDREKFGALATIAGSHPHSTLVAVAAAPDLQRLLLATTRSTRKFSNLQNNARVSLLVDNVAPDDVDFEHACAVTAVGTAREIPEEDREPFLDLYLDRHPYLETFVRSPSCALIEIDVDVYYLTRHFQEVMEWHVKS